MGKSAACGAAFLLCHAEAHRPCSPALCGACPSQQGCRPPCGHRAALGRIQQWCVPTVSRCQPLHKAQERGETDQGVCIEHGLCKSQGKWGFAGSRFGACQSLDHFRGEQPQLTALFSSLPAAALGRDPVRPSSQVSPHFCMPARLLHRGRDWGGDSQGQPSCPSLWCPLCHCLSLNSLLLTCWLASGKSCGSPALFALLTQKVLLCGEWLLLLCFCSLSSVLPYFNVD